MKRALASLALTTLLCIPAWAGTTIDQSVAASAHGLVEISNLSGSVTVQGWSSNQVKVTGTLGDGSDRVEVSSSGDRVVVEVVLPRNARNVDATDLVVQVPALSQIEVETVSASIDVSGIDGRVELESVSGSIVLRGQPDNVEMATVSGKIRAESTSGNAEVETVSGKIEIGQAEGELEVASVSGDIKILAGALDRLQAETTSGEIICRAAPTARADFEMETMSGSVTLEVPAGVSADFDLSTFSGGIHNDIGPAAERSSRHAPGEKASFTIGSGDARIHLSSFSGSVNLRTR